MNDLADARSIAVIRTRLPYIDRRSLSDAWFSALHLAADETASRSRARHGTVAASNPHSSQRSVPAARVAAHEAVSPSRSVRDARAREIATPAERRACDVAKTSRVAAAFARARSYPAFQTSLTVGPEGERVALVLRREGTVLHVVALCAPANVGLVRAALERADALLKRSGEAVLASVRTFCEDAS